MADYTYNGFGSAIQDRATKFMFQRIRRGEIPNYPEQCMACGQTEGIIQYHAEDYSEPFGDHITAFHFCYTCHSFLHRRDKFRAKWDEYRRMVREGWRFVNFPRFDFHGFRRVYLMQEPDRWPKDQYEPPERFWLDEIDAGQHRPTPERLAAQAAALRGADGDSPAEPVTGKVQNEPLF